MINVLRLTRKFENECLLSKNHKTNIVLIANVQANQANKQPTNQPTHQPETLSRMGNTKSKGHTTSRATDPTSRKEQLEIAARGARFQDALGNPDHFTGVTKQKKTRNEDKKHRPTRNRKLLSGPPPAGW